MCRLKRSLADDPRLDGISWDRMGLAMDGTMRCCKVLYCTVHSAFFVILKEPSRLNVVNAMDGLKDPCHAVTTRTRTTVSHDQDHDGRLEERRPAG